MLLCCTQFIACWPALPRRCEGGCTCIDTTLEGHHIQRNSQTYLHKLRVSQAPDCMVSITVAEGTMSGAHKVKVSGVIISEEGGAQIVSAGTAGGALLSAEDKH